jgi:YbbR domain-containing protein
MKGLLLRNWHLKLISLVLATVLWAEVARTPTSEIGLSVSLEYQNIPPQKEVFGDTTDRVEVRLRGPSSLVRSLSSQDLSLSLDMTGISTGQEKILPLSPELVRAPVGVEVVRVIPARVRLSIEPTAMQKVRIFPRLVGSPAAGFEIEKSVVTPDMVEIEGPASHVQKMETIETADINVQGRRSTFREDAELDVEDPVVRIPNVGPIAVEVRIRRK